MSRCLVLPSVPSVPGGVPQIQDIPGNTPLIAIAPYIDSECAKAIAVQAESDNASFLILADDKRLSSSSVLAKNSSVTILGVSNLAVENNLARMAQYLSNTTVTIPSSPMNNTILRVGVQARIDTSSGLPQFWIFILAALAALAGVTIATSLLMNYIQLRRRRNLRRRIMNGEVSLEHLGFKTLTVPQDVLNKIPVLVYTHGEQHFHNDRTDSPASPVPGEKSSSWRRRLSSSGNAGNISIPKVDENHHMENVNNGFSQINCPICLEDFEVNVTQVRQLPCDHIYHLDCIDPFLKSRSNLCPLCKRSVLPPGYIPPFFQLTNVTVRRERQLRSRAQQQAGINDSLQANNRNNYTNNNDTNNTNDSTAQPTNGAPTPRFMTRMLRRMQLNRVDEENQLGSTATPIQHGNSNTPQQPDVELSNLPPANSHAPGTSANLEPNSAIPNNVELNRTVIPSRQHSAVDLHAMTIDEEAEANRRTPGWRRTLQTFFPT